jgi:protein-S-isoprenylcysteine O-methyltransferase Ste14
MNVRLAGSRVLAVSVVALTLVSAHAWQEHGLVDSALGAAGDVLLLAGCVGRIWCALHIAGRKDRELVTEGPFSVVRNPLYFFSLLAFIGAGLSFESLTIAGLFVAVFFATHWPTILREEQKLRGIFGTPYEAYLARVPRLLPNPALYRPAALVSINAPVFLRSMLEAALIPLVFVGAQAIEAAHEHHLLPTLVHLY